MLRRLKIWHKLVGICLVLVVPIVLATRQYIKSADENIDFAQKEWNGDEYTRPLRKLLEHALAHKLEASRIAKGDSSSVGEIKGRENAVDSAIAELDRLEGKAGLAESYGKEFESTEMLQSLKDAWLVVKGNPFKEEDENKLTQATLDLISRVGDKSNLILDPDLDSYYSMDFTLLRFTAGIKQLADIIYQGEGIIARHKITNDEKADMIGLLSNLRSTVDGSEDDYKRGIKNNTYWTKSAGKLAGVVEAPLKQFLTTTRAFIEMSDKRVVHAPAILLTPAEFAKAGEEAMTSLYRLYDPALAGMDMLLEARMYDRRAGKQAVLLTVAICLLVAAILIFFIIRSITHPLRAASEAAKRLARGDLAQSDLATHAGGEAGDLAIAFNEMLVMLREMNQEMSTASTQVASAAAEIYAASQEQEAAAQHQAGGVEEVSRAMQSLLEAATHISESANGVLANAERTRATSDLTAKKIAELNGHTSRMEEMLEVIREIADRSDLLALNASLEGTRAGEAGRGFSLVAAELRRLAERVTASVQNVKALVADVRASGSSTVLATEEGRKLAESTTESARRIALVAQQQRTATEQVSQNMKSISGVLTQSASATRQNRASAETLKNEAERLLKAVRRFRTEDKRGSGGSGGSGNGQHEDRP